LLELLIHIDVLLILSAQYIVYVRNKIPPYAPSHNPDGKFKK